MTLPRNVEALRRAGDENFRVAFALLAERVGRPGAGTKVLGTALAVTTTSQFPFFNPILVNAESAEADDVAAAVDWVRASGVEPVILVRDDLDTRVNEVAARLEYQRAEWLLPGMVLGDPPPAPPGPPELDVALIGETGYREWAAASGPMADIMSEALARDPLVRFVFGRVDGRPVCQAITVDGAGVTGIYSVGTSKDYRGRGYGRAITWAAIDAGRKAWGERPVILQSSEMGAALYRSMGFVEVCRYVVYSPARAVEEDPAATSQITPSTDSSRK